MPTLERLCEVCMCSPCAFFATLVNPQLLQDEVKKKKRKPPKGKGILTFKNEIQKVTGKVETLCNERIHPQ